MAGKRAAPKGRALWLPGPQHCWFAFHYQGVRQGLSLTNELRRSSQAIVLGGTDIEAGHLGAGMLTRPRDFSPEGVS